MIINHNMSALQASRNLALRGSDLSKSMEKLSSGERINRGADDASGLAVSEKLRSQIRGLNQASKNVSNAVSFIQTTEGYLQETQDIVHRLRELAVQSSNGIYTAEDRMQIQVEVSQLVDEIDRIASHAQFNGMNMLTGRFARDTSGINFQIGSNMDQSERVFIGDMSSKSLGLKSEQNSISLETPEDANVSIGNLDTAMRMISQQRAELGAYQNRFEMAQKGIDIAAENMQSAESRIRDTNMASEMVNFVKNQILQSASSSMLAQANNNTSAVMKILD